MYANHTAYGILSGRRPYFFTCRVLYQGLQWAEDAMNVNTSHERSWTVNAATRGVGGPDRPGRLGNRRG